MNHGVFGKPSYLSYSHLAFLIVCITVHLLLLLLLISINYELTPSIAARLPLQQQTSCCSHAGASWAIHLWELLSIL